MATYLVDRLSQQHRCFQSQAAGILRFHRLANLLLATLLHHHGSIQLAHFSHCWRIVALHKGQSIDNLPWKSSLDSPKGQFILLALHREEGRPDQLHVHRSIVHYKRTWWCAIWGRIKQRIGWGSTVISRRNAQDSPADIQYLAIGTKKCLRVAISTQNL